MKTVIDKIDAHPPTRFRRWNSEHFCVSFRLASARCRNGPAIELRKSHSAAVHVRSFSRLERRLVIVSRRVSRDIAMLEVMRCLIRNNSRRLRVTVVVLSHFRVPVSIA